MQALPRRFSILLPFVLVASARAARAEVLDKVVPPWDPSTLVVSLVALVIIGALAASGKRGLQIVAASLAIVWALLRLAMDEWFSEDVGPALRAELSIGEGRYWLAAILIEALLPMVAVVGAVLVGRARRRARESFP